MKHLLLICVLFTLPIAAHAAGAIAVDDEEGEGEPGYGIVTGENSRDEAGREALKQCKASGNENCKVVARFDTCGAYAASKQYYGVGWGATEKAAINMAKEQCGESCRIVVSECE